MAGQLPETLPAERRGQLPLSKAFAVYGNLLADPAALGLMLAGGMSFAAMFAYITAGPFYFIDLLGWSPAVYSLLFGSNALGIFAANYVNGRLAPRRGRLCRVAGVAGGDGPARRFGRGDSRLVRVRQHDRAVGRQLRRPADGALSAQRRRGGGAVRRRPVRLGYAGQRRRQLPPRRQRLADGLGDSRRQRDIGRRLSAVPARPALNGMASILRRCMQASRARVRRWVVERTHNRMNRFWRSDH